jgi:hypothetical protein
VQSGGDDTWDEAWASWKDAQLLNFFVQRAQLHLESAEPQEPVAPTIEPALLSEPVVEPIAVDTPTAPAPIVTAGDTQLAAPAVANFAGQLRLASLNMLPSTNAELRGILHQEQPFDFQLVLDFGGVTGPHDIPLHYIATVYAKSLRGGPRRTIAEARGVIVPTDDNTITLRGTTPPQDVYRLEAMIALTLAATDTVVRSDLVAFREGGLLQIY